MADELKIKYPLSGYTTLESKYGFAIACREKLRLEHNARGAKYKAGTMTREEWSSYLVNEFNPKMAKISEDEPNLLEQIRAKYMPDVDTKEI